MPSKKTKTTVRVDRLRKLADFLDKLQRSHFDFAIVRGKYSPFPGNDCGTVGCAIGWCPTVFPKACHINVAGQAVRIDGRYRSYFAAGARLFGMSDDDAYHLFTPREPSPATGRDLSYFATHKQVARRIRTYAAWCERTGVRVTHE